MLRKKEKLLDFANTEYDHIKSENILKENKLIDQQEK